MDQPPTGCARALPRARRGARRGRRARRRGHRRGGAVSGPPNLFIVGAPKCGTTALTRYLEAHPEVFVADR
ncbi:MAG: sulfotransferase, partial [bacterium]